MLETNGILLTRDVINALGVRETRLRTWIRAGLLAPQRLSNGSFFWPAAEVERARALVEKASAGAPVS